MKYMYRKFLQGILPLASLLAPENTQAQEILLQEFYQQILALEEKGDYEQALDLLKEKRSNFPGQGFKLLKEEVYVQEKLDRFSDNLALFNEGHQKGYFFFLHPSLPAFKPYLELEGFDSISAHDMELRSAAISRSEIIYKLAFPANYSWKSSLPLCFIFHGGGSNLVKVQEHWQSASLNSEFIKVYVQSYLHYDSESYGWRSGDERAFRELREIYSHILQEYPLDSSELYVAGISAGGTFAIDLAIRQILPVSGFITFCPGMPTILSEGQISTLPGVRGFMLGGEDDHYLPRQKEMAELFALSNLSYWHAIVEGMGHHYPVDESNWIEKALQYLRNQNIQDEKQRNF